MLRGFVPAEMVSLFEILITENPAEASEVLVAVEPSSRLTLFENLTLEQVAKLLELAPVDDAVFLLDALPDELKEKVLELVDLEERFSEVQEHFAYPEDTAGRIMDSELVAFDENMTGSEAIDQLRQIAHDVEMITYLYVVDQNGRLTGVTPLRRLLLTEGSATLGEIMNTSLIKAHVDTDQEEVAQLAARYDLLAIPVTDDENHLLGIVTVDDILDVFKEEATEDIFKMAGTSDRRAGLPGPLRSEVAGIRLPWIIFNLGSVC